MKELLYGLGIVLWILCGLIFAWAPSVTQEGIAALIGLGGCVLIGSAAVIGAIQKLPQAASGPGKSDELNTGG